jgi:alpha-glucosidase
MPSLRALLLALPLAAFAQDSVHVASPNGQIEFRVGVILPPAPGSFLRLGYQVSFKGKPLLDTSYLGFLIHNQEPLLGENLGMTASKSGHGEGYNWLLGEFMQNGSLGRRINVEVRAYDQGVAFRYLIPRTSPLEEIVIENEETEFRFARDTSLPFHGDDLPLRVEQAGLGWVAITEVPLADYPRMLLDRTDGRTMKVFLPGQKGAWPVESTTPLTTPWRLLLIGSSADELNSSKILERLKGAAPLP